ncbi:hypothetical protein GCM10009867_17180 [Pedococcus aerophilus]|uniref:Uncharacterized protein n=1 Tax=Pedococcus aerophilus TaxID=436356 RepID=A0ABN3ULX4_9MICO
MALGAGGWFAFMSPHDSTVTLVADTSTAVPGKPVTVTGTVSPAVAHRVVELAVATTAGGAYTPAGTATTDATGRFQTTWTPAQAGKAWVQATAIELGRDQEAQSTAAAVTVRTPATLTLKLSAPAIRTTAAATVTATVAPAGGAVTLEKSSDGTTWTSVPTTTGKGGAATAKLSGLAGGTWHIRGMAAQTDTAGEATGKEATLLVEDYKAAGAKYLAIVAAGNNAVIKLNSMIDAGASQAALRKQAEIISKAYTQEAKALRAYKGWPREVAPVVTDLAKQSVLSSDDFHMRAQSRGVDEWNEVAAQGDAAAAAASADAARIRDMLGLPKRSLHP